MKSLWMSIVLLLMGDALIAASLNDAGRGELPADYWDMPHATSDASDVDSHHGLDLEKNMRPEACAQCHQEQFNAWQDSRHALAYSAGMVGQFPNMGHAAGNDCLVCHAPLAEQLYKDAGDMQATLATLLKHTEGFSRDADLDSEKAKLPLRHAGVTCAVCHVRDGQRFGPPRKGSDVVGQLEGAAHGGFKATSAFESSQFCASCHQFPQNYAINGKPLENTIFEWQQSRFAREGVQCQTCHMPDRKHAFKGIHDVEMVRSGLDFQLKKQGQTAILSIESTHIGHAFPTYVTPKVIIHAEGLNAKDEVEQKWQWSIVREVGYDGGWKEMQDTRLMPGETRQFAADSVKKIVTRIRFSVDVVPDAFYKGVYESLLSDDLQRKSRSLLERALSDANANDYQRYRGEIVL